MNLDPIDQAAVASAARAAIEAHPAGWRQTIELDFARRMMYFRLEYADEKNLPDPDRNRRFAIEMLQAMDDADDDVKAIMRLLVTQPV